MIAKIFDHFPTPKFLSMPSAGLSITDSAVHCIEFEKKHGVLSIHRYTQKAIPPGVIVAGQVNNAEEMKNVLQTIKKELGLYYVRLSLPEEKAYLFTTKIPIVDKSEVYSAVESQIEDNVPVLPAELVFDYKLLQHDGSDHMDVVVSALPISVVNTYIEIVDKAGLSLLSLEIESQAIARALLPKNTIGTALIVHFGREKVGLYVVARCTVHFTSTVPLRAMPVDVATAGQTSELENNLSFLSQEIKKLYIYWHTLKENVGNPNRKIERIIVCGEHLADETVPYLSARNQTPVELGNVWTNVFDINTTMPPITFADSLEYAASIGLALPEDMLI